MCLIAHGATPARALKHYGRKVAPFHLPRATPRSPGHRPLANHAIEMQGELPLRSRAHHNVLIELPGCTVRNWRPSDARAIVKHANDREVWLQLRDRFPHPYTQQHADWFLARACGHEPRSDFAIEVDGEAAGGIGLVIGTDVSSATAEVGYWLGRVHWGRGIMSRVLAAVTAQAMGDFGLHRMFAVPFAGNSASARVLEKAGYSLEGRMRRSAVKDGRVLDQLMYACTDEDQPASCR